MIFFVHVLLCFREKLEVIWHIVRVAAVVQRQVHPSWCCHVARHSGATLVSNLEALIAVKQMRSGGVQC